jgi:hypothetical protein
MREEEQKYYELQRKCSLCLKLFYRYLFITHDLLLIYDMTWYGIWYDMIRYDIWYDIFLKCNWVATRWQYYRHIYAQSIHRTTQNKQHIEQHKNKQYIEQHKNIGSLVRPVPHLCGGFLGICLTTEEKARKNFSQGSWRVPAGTMKIHKHTIRIHRHNNKYTENALTIKALLTPL